LIQEDEMRIALLAVALTALALPIGALAAPPKKAAPKPQPAAAPEPPQAPGFFPCRSEAEVCYVAIVTGKSAVMVQFTNAPQSDGIDQKPQNVFSDEGGSTPLDLGQDTGKVVMLTGSYDAAKGINKAAVVDVASPLLSFLIKEQLGGGDDDEPSPGGGKGAPKKR
jgi:hypothetical protein